MQQQDGERRAVFEVVMNLVQLTADLLFEGHGFPVPVFGVNILLLPWSWHKPSFFFSHGFSQWLLFTPCSVLLQ